MNFNVQIGDIRAVTSEALITLVNSAGMWFGAVDSIVSRAGGFHRGIGAQRTEGAVYVTRREDYDSAAQAPWAHVVFVIDDLTLPLADLVERGLQAAANAGCKNVIIPAMRMGVMLNNGPQDETGLEAKCQAIIDGVRRVDGLESVTLVVYSGDPNKDRIFPLCESAASRTSGDGRELRCIQL